jgi:hypothetical protein
VIPEIPMIRLALMTTRGEAPDAVRRVRKALAAVH